MGAFAYDTQASIEAARFKLVGRAKVIANTKLAIRANDYFFINNHVVDDTIFTNDSIEHDNRVADNRAFFDNHSRRKDAVNDLTVDLTAMRNHAALNFSI